MMRKAVTPPTATPASSFLQPQPAGKTQFGQLKELNARQKLSTIPLLIQKKLAIGNPGDKYEQEAELMAERVMGMSSSAVQRDPT